MKLFVDFKKQYARNPILITVLLMTSLTSIALLFWLYGNPVIYFIFEGGKLAVNKLLYLVNYLKLIFGIGILSVYCLITGQDCSIN